MLAVTWWGHATATVEQDGMRILTDPLLSARLLHLRRRTPAPAPAAERADLVLISHLHRDHLHRPSLRRVSSGATVLVPAGGESLVAHLGLDVRPVAPGDRVGAGPVEVQVLAAHHDGRRSPWPSPAGPALGFRVSGPGGSWWFPGDTGLLEHPDVAPVDLALVPVGGWGPSLGPEHLDPDQAAAAVARVGARAALPVHWGTLWPVGLQAVAPRTFDRLFRTPGPRFATALATAAPATRALLVAPGERVDLGARPG